MMTKCQDMHAEDIKAEVRKRGTNLSQLSRDNGLAESTLRNTLRYHWPKGERIIAGVLGVAPEEIWPSRYGIQQHKEVA
ncbi:helix-turn-helix domain-containing protein [Citrobacter braakii]|uniref:helix-turn-helix domain-containing protein n=1 Tax=Citrobacter braakii TaxID=57706 RepID=UPI00403A58BE